MSATVDTTALAERATLGAALESRAAYERVAQVLDGAAFAEPRHELIWEAIAWVNAQGTPEVPATADEVLVAMRLQELGQLEQVGGALYLDDLVATSVLPSNAVYYARQVKRAALARQIKTLGVRLTQAGDEGASMDDLEQVLAGATEALLALSEDRDDEWREQPPSSAQIIADLEAVDRYIPTGLTDLDRHLAGGLHAGQLVVVAARPGGGKSAFALQVMLNAARQGHRALLYSLEMGVRKNLQQRLVANLAQVPTDRVRHGTMTQDDWARVVTALPEVDDLPILWTDRPNVTPGYVAQRIGAIKRKHPDLGVVIVDYLQLMTPDEKGHTRQEDIAAMTRALKLAANRYDVPIVLLAQLNRAVEHRADKKPQLSDLRESGAIEQDADVVLMLHNPASVGDVDRMGELDVLIRKNRDGAADLEIPVAAQLQYSRLVDLARPEDLRAAA